MKIAFFDIHDWEKEYIEEKLRGNELKFFLNQLNEETAKKITDYEVISVFISSKVPKEIIDLLPKLKMIVTRSTGFDHIDIKYASSKNIVVTNVPTYGSNTVAEHAFALMLDISRKIHLTYERVKKEDFSNEGITGFDLRGKTLGVIGAGKIGLHAIRIARGFGMKVLAFETNPDPFLAETLDFEYVPLERLYKESDIITIHVPLTDKTFHMINRDTINMMKKGVIIINTARGGIIDTDALFEGLKSGKIGGAGLDVIEGEDEIREEKELLHRKDLRKRWKLLWEDMKILKMENVIFTPHNAFNSKEALIRILDTTIENIQCLINGYCKNKVN